MKNKTKQKLTHRNNKYTDSCWGGEWYKDACEKDEEE